MRVEIYKDYEHLYEDGVPIEINDAKGLHKSAEENKND